MTETKTSQRRNIFQQRMFRFKIISEDSDNLCILVCQHIVNTVQTEKNIHIRHINGEREIPGRQKVIRGLSVPVLTSHVGLNPRSKSGYEREARVIKTID